MERNIWFSRSQSKSNSKNAKKSGHILGDPVSGEESATEAWKNPALLEKSIESARLQQEIFSLEMEKT